MDISSGQPVGRKERRPSRGIKYLHQNRHDAWVPNDDYYHRPWEGGGGSSIAGRLIALTTSSDPNYIGLKEATITIVEAPCDKRSLVGTSVQVIDHSGCIFDLDFEALDDVYVWAGERVTKSVSSPSEFAPCHWCANDRCCVPEDA